MYDLLRDCNCNYHQVQEPIFAIAIVMPHTKQLQWQSRNKLQLKMNHNTKVITQTVNFQPLIFVIWANIKEKFRFFAFTICQYERILKESW